MTRPGTYFRTCTLCEAMCGLTIWVTDDGEIGAIRGDKEDPLSKGHICPKAVAMKDVHTDPDRLRTPLKKTPSGWVDVTWKEAFDDIASRIRSIQSTHGRDAVGVYQGNPSVHNSGTLLLAPKLYRSLRTRNMYSATSVDQLPHHIAAEVMFGNKLLLPVPDVDRTDYFLILGANPIASNGSMMTAPGMSKRIASIKNRGGEVVVLDPRRTETAAVATQHLFVRPGSDVFFLLALLHTIREENLTEAIELGDYFEGLDQIASLAESFSPESVEGTTGIVATRIRDIARSFCAADSAVVYGRMGVSTQQHGTLCQWLINVINAVTGNLDSVGGAMFTRPAIDILDHAPKAVDIKRFGERKTRVRGLPVHAGEPPVATLADEINTPGKGQIRAMIISAGNPVLSTPNGSQLERALGSLDFMVSIDIYLNETSLLADYILPPRVLLENDHYDLVFHILAVRNTAKYSPAIMKAERGTLPDWQIYRELFRRIRPPARSLRERLSSVITDRLSPERMLDLGLRKGPWGGGFGPGKGLTLKKLKRAVHGIDLGPLTPCLPDRLYHDDKRVQLTPQPLVDAVRSLRPETVVGAGDAAGSFVMIGRRDLRSNNSWMHNSQRLVKGKSRCTLHVHPDDALRVGIETEQMARVVSRIGELHIEVEVTPDVMPGVVSIPHGWGHDRPGIGLSIASQRPGVSINDLTDDRETDAISGNAILNGTPVNVFPANNQTT